MTDTDSHRAVEVSWEADCSGLLNDETVPDALGEALRIVLEETGLGDNWPRCELGVTLTDDEGIRRLNRDHREIDSATDTLSFPVSEPDEIAGIRTEYDPPLALGDLVLSPETIERQAKERGMGFIERFGECLVHGILHLLGWGHEEEDDREAMEMMEDRLAPKVINILSRIDVEEN